jgi:tRNA(Ile)-lysidine synthetase-like protein
LAQRVLSRAQTLSRSLAPGAAIAVGFSGGPDSLALAAVLADLGPVVPLRPLLIHVDHGLRESSAANAVAAVNRANRLGLPCEVRRLAPDPVGRHPGVGLEEAARRERYVVLAEFARSHGTTVIALAHHLDDQAETVLLHLLRGAGPAGAAGMAEIAERRIPWWDDPTPAAVRTVTIWRPFLAEPRATVRAYAAALGLTAVVDESNDDPSFRRNALRREVMPAIARVFPTGAAALGRYARIAAEEDRYLDAVAERALAQATTTEGTLDWDFQGGDDPAIGRRVVVKWLRREGVQCELGLDRIEAVMRAASRTGPRRRVEICHGYSVEVTVGRLRLARPAARTGEE